MSEQLSQTATSTSGGRWGDSISEERQEVLLSYLKKWEHEENHGDRKGPFDCGRNGNAPVLSAADIAWLADETGRDMLGAPYHLHLEGATLFQAHLEHADLRSAHLAGAILHLAHLEGANLTEADLRGARLDAAHLEGTRLEHANLESAHLTSAIFDVNTILDRAKLDTHTRLGDIRWNGVGIVDLTRIDWNNVTRLGEEDELALLKTRHVGKHFWVGLPEAVVRANRQIATQLRAQGMTEAADRFAYRAQVVQRLVLRRKGRWLAAFGSWLLDRIAGYGYRPGRSFLTYIGFVTGFALIYIIFRESVHPALNPLDALIFSITSFHGRGFSPGETATLHNPLTIFAAIEAIIGLLIEITFIATFTQRFFAR